MTDAYQGDPGVPSCGGRTGELCSTTSGGGNVTAYAYDPLGQLTSVTEPGGSCGANTRKLCTTITYDASGRPSTVTDGKGQVTTYHYDLFDRITEILTAGTTTCHPAAGTCVEYAYDADGNVTSRSDSTGTTTFAYDPLGRLTTEDLPGNADKCAGASPAGITLTYDAASNLSTYCDAGGVVSYRYNPDNLTSGVATDGGSCAPGAVVQPCTTYAYTDASDPQAVTSITYPTSTGVTDTLGYDGANHQTSDLVAKGSTDLQAMAYSYTDGTTDRQLIQASANFVAGTAETYSYDNLDRLTGATGANTDAYAYDADGNLTSETLNGGTLAFAYNADDAACWAVFGSSGNSCASPPQGADTYTYDANGNLTATSAGESLGYNALNQTTSITPAGGSPVSFAYTGTDSTERTSAGSTTFANSVFGVAEQTTSGAHTFFTRDPTGRLSSILVGATRYYVYYNGSGSIGGVFDSSGNGVASYAYDPYGSTTASGSNPNVDPFRFEGGYFDSQTSLYKFGTRYDDPLTASWTQQDSIAGTIQNPQAVNRYPYAGDDPVNFVDPSGLEWCSFSPVGCGTVTDVTTYVSNNWSQLLQWGQDALACYTLGSLGFTLGAFAGGVGSVAGATFGCAVGVGISESPGDA